MKLGPNLFLMIIMVYAIANSTSTGALFSQPAGGYSVDTIAVGRSPIAAAVPPSEDIAYILSWGTSEVTIVNLSPFLY